MSDEQPRREWRQHVPTRDGMHISLWQAAERRAKRRDRTAYAKAVRRLKRARTEPLKIYMRIAARTDMHAKQWLANKGIR